MYAFGMHLPRPRPHIIPRGLRVLGHMVPAAVCEGASRPLVTDASVRNALTEKAWEDAGQPYLFFFNTNL